MSLAYIREQYAVPAYRGREVLFTGLDRPVVGRIISSYEQYLYIRTEDGKRFGPLHPTWEMDYRAREYRGTQAEEETR